MGQQPEPQDHAVDVVLAEFNAMTAQITTMLGSQQTLVSLNLTATAAVAGLVLAQKVNPKLLLVVAVLSSALGFVYLANALHLENLGSYIDEVLRPIIVEHTGDDRLFSSERRFRARGLTGQLSRGLAVGTLFSGVPTIVLILLVPQLDTSWAWVGWSLAACFLILQLGSWAWLAQRALRRMRFEDQ